MLFLCRTALLAAALLCFSAMPAWPATLDTGVIGFMKLSQPLPFTPQEMAEPFGWKLKLIETPTEVTIKAAIIGTHFFTFYRDKDGKIRSLYSPRRKNDAQLCEALNILKTERPPIYEYLDSKFQASSHCVPPSRKALN